MRFLCCFFWGAHAPRVLVSALRRNNLFWKFAMAGAPSLPQARDEARALPRSRQRSRYGIVNHLVVLVVLLAGNNMLAQEAIKTPDSKAMRTPPALSEEEDEKAWSFSASATTYFVPDDREYVQPTFTADRGWLHLEARYNYENLKTGSVWIGYNFSGGKKLEWEFTPMLGGVFGNTTGLAPGYKLSLTYWKLEFSSEGEFVYDTGNSEDNFTYNWSELSFSPVEWFRFGLVGQRTRVYQTDVDIQRGLLVGFSYKKMNVTTYVFNLDQGKPTWVFSVGVTF
jgi:hypothetical protein